MRIRPFLLLLILCSFPVEYVCAQQKNATVFPGADNLTPSRSEYESWINNTNEGSTEMQTLANLDFFRWLQSEYGMNLDIYSISAGAIDKAGWYGTMSSPVFKHQFPNGFDPIYKKAASMGVRLGTWGGPDGFGNTPEEEKAREEMIVSLCRNYHFELLKFDAVVGELRPEKQDAFVRMMKECRKYSPDLILLNHRLDLGEEGNQFATTRLWDGEETYIDVHMSNDTTAIHHREGALSRGLVPGLKRLTEDHGVCLSSCLDFWEDDLVLQTFNRNLILAPEIYGNPWLLRDDEYPELARIFNLAEKYGKILVNGMVLPESTYGKYAVSRGNTKTRLITLRNLSWLPETRTITLNEEIGLANGKVFEVRLMHPVERLLGRFEKGQKVNIEVLPFRSCLILVTSESQDDITVEGCDYQLIQHVPGKPVRIDLLAFPGEKKNVILRGTGKAFKEAFIDGKPEPGLLKGIPAEISFQGEKMSENYHRKLGDMLRVAVPDDAESLYEATCFAADNNALEVRSLERSGASSIPEVNRAREAFFRQELFKERGLWDKYMFDDDMTTSFYPTRRQARTDPRINGGSLRVDMGKLTSMDSLKIYVGDEQGLQPFKSWEAITFEISADLKSWQQITILAGKTMTLPLDPDKPFRYIRLNGTPEKVLEIKGYLGGKAVDRSNWRASNLFSPYRMIKAKAAFENSFTLNEIPKGSYLAIALNGKHGDEGAYAAIRVNGKPVGAPDRSPSYRSNTWEYPVIRTESNYTYYIPLAGDMKGAKIDAVVLVMNKGYDEFKPEVWITAYPMPYEKKKLVLK